MKIDKHIHCHVLPDGTFKKGAGAVATRGIIVMSNPKSENHWLSVTLPRTDDGIVESIKVKFENKKEMDQFFINRYLICN